MGDKEYKQDKPFLAWFAGFWEGEGCFYIGKGEVIFNVAQNNKKPLKYIQERTGLGYVTSTGPENRYSVWKLGNKDSVMRLVPLLIPYLQFRKEEVINKLEILAELDKESTRREWSPFEIHILKEQYIKHTDRELSVLIPRHTEDSICFKRGKLELMKYRKHSNAR